MVEVDGGGGWWMVEVDGGGGWWRWMVEVDGGWWMVEVRKEEEAARGCGAHTSHPGRHKGKTAGVHAS